MICARLLFLLILPFFIEDQVLAQTYEKHSYVALTQTNPPFFLSEAMSEFDGIVIRFRPPARDGFKPDYYRTTLTFENQGAKPVKINIHELYFMRADERISIRMDMLTEGESSLVPLDAAKTKVDADTIYTSQDIQIQQGKTFALTWAAHIKTPPREMLMIYSISISDESGTKLFKGEVPLHWKRYIRHPNF